MAYHVTTETMREAVLRMIWTEYGRRPVDRSVDHLLRLGRIEAYLLKRMLRERARV